MSGICRVALACFTLLAFCSPSIGQTPPVDSAASISGQVTINGKGAAGVTVTATTTTPLEARVAAKAITDEEGNYRVGGLPTGRFTVTPVAKAYAASSSGMPRNQLGRTLNVLAGEEITKVNFALVRGGVITGRITDADGSPIIGEQVSIVLTDNQASEYIVTIIDGPRSRTDDRGIFRVYGLAPGRYKVSVGQAKPDRMSSVLYRNGSQYIQTFYPGVHEESKAELIEVKEGSEAKDIDIKTSKGSRGFSVSGQIVDSASDKTVAGVYVGYSPADESTRGGGGMSFSPSPSDANGRFTFEGLQPGRYVAFTFAIGPDNSTYSELANFEIVDSDVTGLEIKLSRGATINGIAVIENSPDPAVSAILQTVSIYGFSERKAAQAPAFARAKIGPDGRFKLSGLAPGKFKIQVQEFPKPPKALRLLRVELNGVEQREGLEITAGAEINDVRLVFLYGGGILRGTVKVTGAPEGTIFYAVLRSGAENRGYSTAMEVDSRGHFSAENIPPGTYELTLRGSLRQGDVPGFAPIKKTVSIAHDVVTEISLEANFNPNK